MRGEPGLCAAHNTPLPPPPPLLQVRVKATALAEFMAAQQHHQGVAGGGAVLRTYALLTLANKLVSQCEVQVRRVCLCVCVCGGGGGGGWGWGVRGASGCGAVRAAVA